MAAWGSMVASSRPVIRLAIVRKLQAAITLNAFSGSHGKRPAVESGCFCCRVGVGKPGGGSVPRGGRNLDHSHGAPKIVIADDNFQNVELLEAYLSDFNCEIRTAHDGEETLQVVDEFAPDVLLLDVMMPRLSGFEVCKKIRANPATKDLLILMVTALNEAADFERGVQAGTDDFLTKPVNKIELLCRIRSLLRVQHLKTQLDRTLAYLAEFEATSRESPAHP
jgi:two-component system, OmpR family, alkaline phosphatase synthesis response regulator PhoP